MIPKLYEKDNTYIGELTECSRAIVIEERNGMFELEIDYQLSSPYSDKLIRGNIIVVDTNDKIKEQMFRIYKVTKNILGHFTIYGRHISYDIARDRTAGLDITNQSCEYCLNSLFRSSRFSQNFKGYSDIVNAQNFKVLDSNLLTSIVGQRGSIIDTFGSGAEILRDNYNFHVLNKRGGNNGVVIEYANNLTGLDYEEDEEGLITIIRAIATKSASTEEGRSEEQETVSVYVTSDKVNDYETPFIGEIDFSERFEEDEEITEEKLISLAEKYFEDNKCDEVKFSYKIEFIPLSKCAGYENIQDEIELCDTVRIIDYRFGLDTEAKVIKTTFDVLKERYESMELGSPRSSLGDIVNTDDNKGDKGDKGDKGEDGSIEDFPQTLPDVPSLFGEVHGFGSIELNWTFESKVYYSYELYASMTQGFTPNEFDLIHQGQTSSFLFQVEPGQTWYFRVCGKNSYGDRTEFSNELAIVTQKVEDMENYFTNLAISNAVVGTLSSDNIDAGTIKGEWIDAKNLSVTDGNGKRTLDIDSFGNVYIDGATINATAGNLTDGISQVEQTADKINWIVKSGTNSSDMILTDDMLRLTAQNVDITGKVTFSSFDSEVTEFIEEVEGATDKVDLWSGGTTTINGDYITTGVIADAEEKIKIDLNNGKIEINSADGLVIDASAVITEEEFNEVTEEMEVISERLAEAELKIQPENIISTVTSDEKFTQVEQSADKINWIISNGNNATNMEFTDEAIYIMSENINLDGKVTFNSFSGEVADSAEAWNSATDKVDLWSGGTTTINGSHIKTGVISDEAGKVLINLDAGEINVQQDSFTISVGDKTTTLATVEEIESNRAKIEELEETVSNLENSESIDQVMGELEDVKNEVDNLSNEVARVENRVSYAEQEVTQDSIINKVVSSENWIHATGGVNTIPNPTAYLNMNGWTSATGSYITRYQAVETSAVTPTAEELPSYVPEPPNTTPTVDDSTLENIYIDQSDDIRHPELHLIEPYGGGLAMMLIDCSGKVIFIDGGYYQNGSHCVEYIKGKQVCKIDYYISTHCHTDHCECTPTILDNIPCDNVILKTLDKGKLPSVEFTWNTDAVYDNLVSKCNEKNISILEPAIHSYIKLSNYSGLYIYNSHNSYFDNYNHQSLMLMYVYKDKKLFLAGDGTEKSDISVLGSIGKVDFLQLGHHGDGTGGGSSQALIDELRPTYSYFASAFLATEVEESAETTTLNRVSFVGSQSFSHGTGHNNDFMVYITSEGIKHGAITTTSTSCWYERSKDIWYYFKSDGNLAKDESLTIGEKVYHFDTTGICTNPY